MGNCPKCNRDSLRSSYGGHSAWSFTCTNCGAVFPIGLLETLQVMANDIRELSRRLNDAETAYTQLANVQTTLVELLKQK